MRAGVTAAIAPEDAVVEAITRARAAVRVKMGGYALHEAVAGVWDLITFANQYMNEKKPWDKEVAEADKNIAIGNGLALLTALADLLAPFLPNTAAKIKAGETGMLFPRIT